MALSGTGPAIRLGGDRAAPPAGGASAGSAAGASARGFRLCFVAPETGEKRPCMAPSESERQLERDLKQTRGDSRSLSTRLAIRASQGVATPPKTEARRVPAPGLGVKTLHVAGAISRLSMYLDLEVDRLTETETDRPILSYPSDVPSLMESLDSGHTTVKTENSRLSRRPVYTRTQTRTSSRRACGNGENGGR